MPIQDIIAIILIAGIFILAIKHVFSHKDSCGSCSCCKEKDHKCDSSSKNSSF